MLRKPFPSAPCTPVSMPCTPSWLSLLMSRTFKDCTLLPLPQFFASFSLPFPLGSGFFYKVAELYRSPLLPYHLPSVTTQLEIDWRKNVKAGIVSSHFLPSPRTPQELIHTPHLLATFQTLV